MAKKKSSFAAKVAGDSKNQQSGSSNYGVLSLPKGTSVFTPEPGSRVRLDFLPYTVTDEKHPDRNDELDIATPDSLWYKRPFMVHRNVGSGNDTVVCLQSIGKKCPICEHRAKMMKEGKEKEETDALRPSRRNLYIVIPLDSKKHKPEPHIMDISQYLFQNLLNDELDESPDNGIFPDLEEGLTLKVRFDSKQFGKGNPYAEASRIDFLDREEQYDEEILEKVPNLDAILTILSYEKLSSKFYELEDEEKEDDDDAKPAKKTSKPAAKDDDDEDEKPARKKKVVEEEPAKVEWSWKSLENLSYKKLIKLADESDDIDVDTDDFEDEDQVEELREAIAKELGVKVPKKEKPSKKEDDEEDEDPKPKRGSAGQSVRGKTAGVKKEEVEEEEEDEKPAAKKPTRKEQPEVAAKGSKSKCPFGHKFGEDLDTKKDCDKCKVWDDCLEASEKQ